MSGGPWSISFRATSVRLLRPKKSGGWAAAPDSGDLGDLTERCGGRLFYKHVHSHLWGASGCAVGCLWRKPRMWIACQSFKQPAPNNDVRCMGINSILSSICVCLVEMSCCNSEKADST